MLPILYNIAVESRYGQALIDWGNEQDWLARYRDLLEVAERISLIPKDGCGLPVVTVVLGGRRWIVFSRIYGSLLGGDGQIRLYCIGWQDTLAGTNIKALTWVYPNGVIECAEEPSYWSEMLNS